MTRFPLRSCGLALALAAAAGVWPSNAPAYDAFAAPPAVFMGCGTLTSGAYASYPLDSITATMSNEYCRSACWRSGKAFSGTKPSSSQIGSGTCQCADAISLQTTNLGTICQSPCPGDTSDRCGDSNFQTIYAITKSCVGSTGAVYPKLIVRLSFGAGLNLPKGLAASPSAIRTIETTYGEKLVVGEITDQQWNDFLKSAIDPKFDGYTVTDSLGSYKGAKEKSRVVGFVLAPSPGIEKSLGEIIAAYVDAFDQDSVLKEEVASCVDFVENPKRQ